MRFTALVSGAFFLAAMVSAQPVVDSADGCCCCDGAKDVISCTLSIAKADCVCTAAQCSKSAPTVWDDKPAPVQPDEFKDACCCCDANMGVMSCSRSLKQEECMCSTVQCPAGAPKVWEAEKPKEPVTDEFKDSCCCCDANVGVMSCSRTLKQEECMCSAVKCPASAPKVWEDQKPKGPKESEFKDACCCCDANVGVMSCSRSLKKDECMCSTVKCPASAPMVWEDQKPKGPEDSEFKDACCCCDIGKEVLSCSRTLTQDQCVCSSVQCPAGAPKVWEAEKPKEPVTDEFKDSCCCCDANLGVMSCSRTLKQDECMCSTVNCPAGAKKVWEDKKDDEFKDACCCCDANLGVMSCSRSLKQDECMCASVKCPSTAPKVWEEKEDEFKDACCCCDSNFGVMSCSSSIKQADCQCAAVQCPAGAPKVWSKDKLASANPSNANDIPKRIAMPVSA